MATDNWGVDFTIVAGADLSARQYRAVNESGVLSTSATNGIGILQNKPQSGEHATVRKVGVSKAVVAAAVTAGQFVGFSGASSGFLAVVTSGGIACGRVVSAAASGYLAGVYLFGGPCYIAL
jgi:hypothetical protein